MNRNVDEMPAAVPAPETAAAETPEKRIYKIHVDALSRVEKRFESIARKCAKYNCPFSYEIVRYEKMRDSENISIFHDMAVISVSGTAQINGGVWQFVGKIEHTENGNILKNAAPEYGDLPEKYRNAAPVCEHCGTIRPRVKTYIVRNRETGEYRQIGGSCVAEYAFGLSAESVAAFWDCVTDLENMNGRCGGYEPRYFEVETVLAYAAAITAKTGYFSADSDISTRRLVFEMFDIGYIKSRPESERISEINKTLRMCRVYGFEFTAADFGESAHETARAVIEFYKSEKGGNSDFAHNARVMVSGDYCTIDNFGVLCYLPAGYMKACEKAAERARRETLNHSHFGNIGERVKNAAVLNVRTITEYETCYGITYIVEIEIDGNIPLIWKTSKYPADFEDAKRVSFTVKEHGEYHGTPQTIVTRCMFTN